jgi:hypothetical protein
VRVTAAPARRRRRIRASLLTFIYSGWAAHEKVYDLRLAASLGDSGYPNLPYASIWRLVSSPAPAMNAPEVFA